MDVQELRRRLAAILSADAAGYSRLMAADEPATVQALDAARAVFRQQVEAQQGRVVDTAGDSVLAVFETAAGAVSAAMAIQQRLEASAASEPEDQRLHFRIGVHLGDLIEKADGTVYGDGVNIAARLQALADPGGIVVSDAVHGAVRGKVAADFVDRGEQLVKNLPHPVRAYAAVPGRPTPGPAAPPVPPRLPLPDVPSIAVLPFTNMSGDPEQDYFADGMVEDIITALARFGMFFVIARNSSFVYKGRAVDVRTVGRELGVRYVVEGSVRRAGGRLRITGQLVEAETGHHLWADRFEGALDDLFELQDRITGGIVTAIEGGIRHAEIDRALAKPTSSLQAHDLILRAFAAIRSGATPAVTAEALSFVDRALQIDPRYAMAKAVGAHVCFLRVASGYGSAEDVRTGLRYAEEAVAEGYVNAQVLAVGGMTLGYLGYRAPGKPAFGFRYDEAQRAVDQALRLAPNLMAAQSFAGMVRVIVGDGEAALAHFERAIRMSPVDPTLGAITASISLAHLLEGRFELALDAAHRSIDEMPKFATCHRMRVMALGFLGRIDEATTAAQRMLEFAPGFTVSRFLSVSPYKDPAFRERIAEIFRAAGIPE